MKLKKRKIIISTIFSTIIASVGIFKYLKREINTEGTKLWRDYATLDELEARREKVGKQFREAGINNLTDEEYNKVECEKHILDKIIGAKKNAEYDKKHPNAHLPYREDGWYTPNKD